MARETLHDLLLDDLKDIYDAEHQIVKALPKMIKIASSVELKDAFQNHLEQTARQISRLEQAFELLGKKASRKTCKAMKGLIAEGEDLIGEHEASPLLDASIIGSAQRIEHYEIAAYDTSHAYAEVLGEAEVADLLKQTLDEEWETNDTLTAIRIEINEMCVRDTIGSGSKAKTKSSQNS